MSNQPTTRRPYKRRSHLTDDALIDTIRHDTTDIEVREIDTSDIKAAYRDQTGKSLNWSYGDWDWNL